MAGKSPAIKLGLIGCGRVTETWHLPVLQLLPEAQVLAVADVNPERLHAVADRFSIEQQHTDFQAVLDNPAIEAVAVCVPAQLHAEVAGAALAAGKHVFIEKPLALSLEECDQLIAQTRQSPGSVMVGFNMRWHRLIRQAHVMLQQGSLGALEVVRTVFTSSPYHASDRPVWKQYRARGGGVLIEQAVHHVDLWRFLLGTEVEEVFAISRSAHSDDETATITARMRSGVQVVSVFSERTCASHEVELYGQAGRLHVSCYRLNGLEFSPVSGAPGTFRAPFGQLARGVKALPHALSVWRRGGVWLDSYRAEWQHFFAVIRQRVSLECTLEDGRHALQVVLAALQSASLGEPVQVAQAPRTIPPVFNHSLAATDNAS